MRIIQLTTLAVLGVTMAVQPASAQSNAKVKLTEGALTKLVRALGAKGETSTFRWSIAATQVRVRSNGVRLEGTLIARSKKTLVLKPRIPIGNSVRNPTRPISGAAKLMGSVKQRFSIPMSVSLSGDRLNVKLKNQLIGVKNAKGKKLGTVNLSPFFKLRSRLGLSKINVNGASFWPELKEMTLQRNAGYLMFSTRVDL